MFMYVCMCMCMCMHLCIIAYLSERVNVCCAYAYGCTHNFDNTPHKYRFLPCGMTAVKINIFLLCGVVRDRCN